MQKYNQKKNKIRYKKEFYYQNKKMMKQNNKDRGKENIKNKFKREWNC